jgi:hypothetical protein
LVVFVGSLSLAILLPCILMDLFIAQRLPGTLSFLLMAFVAWPWPGTFVARLLQGMVPCGLMGFGVSVVLRWRPLRLTRGYGGCGGIGRLGGCW